MILLKLKLASAVTFAIFLTAHICKGQEEDQAVGEDIIDVSIQYKRHSSILHAFNNGVLFCLGNGRSPPPLDCSHFLCP